MKKHWKYLLLLLLVPGFLACGDDPSPLPDDPDDENPTTFERSYAFSRSMPENVLRSYLSRSITMAEFLTADEFIYDSAIPQREDDERMLIDMGAKFVGRSIFMWGSENKAANPDFFAKAKQSLEQMHALDGDLIFQACIFEIVTTKVNEIAVPAWVFEAFNLDVEDRMFDYSKMINTSGKFVNQWADGASVPDVSRLETRMWFYFLAKNYIDIGIEAIHWGQVELDAMADKNNNYEGWNDVLTRVRDYASENARRKFILSDGHVPGGGLVVDGNLLLDFHSFPLRMREIYGKSQETELVLYYEDAFYRRSKGGTTPSGWEIKSLPYLVEFDNFGISSFPGEAKLSSTWVWGYDEITWFSLQPEDYRNEFLKYAWDWIEEYDPIGNLQMPGNRKVVPYAGSWNERYRANRKTADFEHGYSQEETIKQIWSDDE